MSHNGSSSPHVDPSAALLEAGGTVGTQQLADFTRQLGAMVDVGVDILRALRVASQHSGSAELTAISAELVRLLQDGRELHQALARHPGIFGAFYVEIVRQGEQDGQLGTALLAVADYLEKAQATGVTPGTEPEALSGAGAVLDGGFLSQPMMALGAVALGAAVLWGLSAAGVLPERWLPPLGLAWAGICLLVGAGLMKQARPATSSAQAAVPLPKLAPKSPERRRQEARGLAQSILMEQDEEQEASPLSEAEKRALLDPPEPFR